MATRILLRRDTSANWASANPVLANGEIGYDTTLDRIKVGDGSTAWSSLPFTTNVDIASNANAGLLSASDYAELSGATANNTASKIVKRDASGNFSVNLISASGTPSSASHLTTKSYVDALVNGLDVKASVRVATTEDSDLSGLDTIDGVTVVAGDRILVKSQTDGTQNGIYVAAAGSWSRATDCDVSAEVTSGFFTFVSEGTANADSGWVLTTNDPITVGSTSLTFTQFSGAGQITAGIALTKTGNTLDVDLIDSTSSTSTIAAATPASVKSAYDLAATKAKVTRQATAPSSPANGDIWIESDNGDVGYVYDSSSATWITFKGDLPPDATTSVKGIVMLESATNSTSTTKAATPSAVKAAYDLATTSITTAGTAQTAADAATAAAASAIQASLVTAKGDVIAATANGAVDNVAVGANNTIFVADSAETAGVKWTASIQPTTLTVGSTATFNGTSAFNGTIDAQEITEKVVPITLSTNTGTLDWTAGNIYYIATAPSAAMTFNVTNVPTTENRVTTINVFVTQGATGYIPSTFQIDGSPQTIRWSGGNAPTPTSSAGKIDVFSFTMQRASGAWIVYAAASLNY